MTAPHALTLDALFRRAGVRDARALALADPPNRAVFMDGAPRRLTYAEADRAITAFAATLRGLGLSAGTVVGLHLPNTVESVVAFLGTLRAGMVAAPLPLLWRRQDMVEALGRAGAKAIVTMGRIGACAHAELAMEVAAELFPIRQICAFGGSLPDGVVPLDGIFTHAAGEPPHRSGDATAAVAITFDSGESGSVPVSHDAARLLAAGASLALAGEFTAAMPILSTIPPASFGGLAVTLVPWLIAGGALHLHHGFDSEAFAAQAAALEGGAVIVPGAAMPALGNAVGPSNRLVALWRAPLRAAAERPATNTVDAVAPDETAFTVAARDGDGLPDPGVIAAAEKACAPGVIAVGAYKFRQPMLDASIAAADPAAMIAALPDALLGNRLAGHAPDGARVAAALAACGANALLAQAFRARQQPLPSTRY